MVIRAGREAAALKQQQREEQVCEPGKNNETCSPKGGEDEGKRLLQRKSRKSRRPWRVLSPSFAAFL